MSHLADTRRLEALRSLHYRQGERIVAMDHIAKVAVEHFKVPIALVTLLDDTRQCFAGRQGLSMDGTPLQDAFCRFAIRGDEVMVVEDAHRDPRFASNPLVTGEPYIRFYAGAPLMYSDVTRIGTVCIIDREPRTLNFGQKIVLKQLATIAMAELRSVTLAA